MYLDLVMPCPKRPDIDCIAGAVGYAEYYRAAHSVQAMPWLCGTPDGAARFYIDLFPEVEWATEGQARDAKGYVLVDFSTAVPLPPLVDTGKVVEVVDHRFLHDPRTEFPNAKIQLEAVGAAATLIAEKFILAGVEPSRPAAAMLHGAIHSNTLNFQSSLTTERDRFAYTWLEKYIDNPLTLIDRYQQAHKEDILSCLAQTLLDDTKMYEMDGRPMAFTQIEFSGGVDIWRERREEIVSILQTFQTPVVLNIVDIGQGLSLTYTPNAELSEKLSNVSGARLQGCGAFAFQPPLLRKQLCFALGAHA